MVGKMGRKRPAPIRGKQSIVRQEKGNMLFNKKPEDNYPQDYSTNRQSAVDEAPMPSRKTNGSPTRSVIDSWLMITGNLQSEGEVQVDGQINGDIRCAHLTVGKDATIIGNITAEEVVVRGKVKGTIRANRVILQDSAHVESEIFHKKLSIEEGACFEGQSRVRENPMTAEVVDLQQAAAGMKAASAA
jgi:cytoskeletal protein CcmA (bactofilin family)